MCTRVKGGQLGQLLVQLALSLRQGGGDINANQGVQVATTFHTIRAFAGVGQAAPSQAQFATRTCACRHGQQHLVV